MPKLPVARLFWKPQLSLQTAAEVWILAGGAHHTVFSCDITSEHMADWAEMGGVELLLIGNNTDIRAFKNEIRWNERSVRI